MPTTSTSPFASIPDVSAYIAASQFQQPMQQISQQSSSYSFHGFTSNGGNAFQPSGANNDSMTGYQVLGNHQSGGYSYSASQVASAYPPQPNVVQNGAMPWQDQQHSAPQRMAYSDNPATGHCTYGSPTEYLQTDGVRCPPPELLQDNVTSTVPYTISVLASPVLGKSKQAPGVTAVPVPEHPPMIARSYETPATVKATRVMGLAQHVPGEIDPEQPVIQTEVVGGDRVNEVGDCVPLTYGAPTLSETMMYVPRPPPQTGECTAQVPQHAYADQSMVMTQNSPYYLPQESIIYQAPQKLAGAQTYSPYATSTYTAQGGAALGGPIPNIHQSYPSPQIVTFGANQDFKAGPPGALMWRQ